MIHQIEQLINCEKIIEDNIDQTPDAMTEKLEITLAQMILDQTWLTRQLLKKYNNLVKEKQLLNAQYETEFMAGGYDDRVMEKFDEKLGPINQTIDKIESSREFSDIKFILQMEKYFRNLIQLKQENWQWRELYRRNPSRFLTEIQPVIDNHERGLRSEELRYDFLDFNFLISSHHISTGYRFEIDHPPIMINAEFINLHPLPCVISRYHPFFNSRLEVSFNSYYSGISKKIIQQIRSNSPEDGIYQNIKLFFKELLRFPETLTPELLTYIINAEGSADFARLLNKFNSFLTEIFFAIELAPLTLALHIGPDYPNFVKIVEEQNSQAIKSIHQKQLQLRTELKHIFRLIDHQSQLSVLKAALLLCGLDNTREIIELLKKY